MTQTTVRLDWPECQQLVADRIETFFRGHELRAQAYGRPYSALWSSARSSADGGKMLRPTLVGNTYRHLGGSNDEQAITVATAFELMHTAFLMHDDVIDNDIVRRGQANLIGTFISDAEHRGVTGVRARAWGEASAILAGDLLIHASTSMVARLDLDAETRSALLDLLDECLFVTVAGELADVAFSTGVQTPVLSEVLSMTEWKTANYSFQAPLQAGAVLAGAPDHVRSALGSFGAQIGLAFQLRDDILGVFGDEGTMGKSKNSDLDAAKITPLMFYALQMSPGSELLDRLHAPQETTRDYERIRALIEASGARALIEGLIMDRQHQAMLCLDTEGVPASLASYLRGVAQRACERSA